MLERFGQELRYAIRTLGKSPGFAVLSVLTLALGIGVNTAMFSVVNGILLKPLTYSDPGRLVTMYVEVPLLSRAYPVLPISAYYLSEWRKQSRSIDGVSALSAVSLNLTGAGDPERLNGVGISANFFTLLGVQPQLGCNFLPDEDQPDRSRVVILSDGLWRRRFGANPQIAGSTIQLNGISRLVAGVMPADFRFPKNEDLHRLVKMPEQTDFWIPLAFRPEETQRMVNQNYAAVARLKPGVSLQAASTELNAILKRLPNMPKDFGPQVHLNPLQTDMVARVRPGLMVLMAAVAAVLLISCINIANLLLTRATNRRCEIAVRAALGATRLELCITPLAESLAISFAGAATGILTAYWLIHLVLLKLPIDLPRMDEVALDGRTLAFAIFVTLLSALSCALAPAWRYASGDPARGYQNGGRSSTGGQSATHLRSVLVSLESGMCALLLIVAGLLVHSFIKITGLDQGFRTSNVIAAEVTLSGNNYQQGQARGAFYQSVLAKLQSLPGTEAAGAVSVLPLTGETNIIGIAPEGAPNRSWGEAPQAEYRYASAGYFAAAGIPVLRGNVFEDRPDGPRVAVISARTADRVWHGQDPIGRRFNSPQSQGNGITVVGIVGDVRSTGLDREPPFMVYLPVAQDTPGGITFVVRTSDPNPAIRQAVAAVDRAIPVAKIRRLDQLIMDAAAVRRFQMLLLTCFASMALLLAAIGMYGVVSYSVAQRRSELGIRIALGAEYKSILALVLWGGLKPVIIGLMVGMAGAFITGRLIGSLLFSVAPFDPLVYASAITLLALASLAACWMPARAAARTDPMTSIRCE